MNAFELIAAGTSGLKSAGIQTVQVNIGLRCNQACFHCHLGASPERTEMMDRPTMEKVISVVRDTECHLVDITGGAPELNPQLRRFIEALRSLGVTAQVRTNLTALQEPGNEDLPEFFRKHRVQLVGSMPCYLEENVRAQRGPRVYEQSAEAIQRLNALGYGKDHALVLNLVYNPGGPCLPPEQDSLEADYRRELGERFGIHFTHLLTITNMPIGRFLSRLQADSMEDEYLNLLRDSFNPSTIDALMCRHQISIAWDGSLYDCDFNLALGMKMDHGAPEHIEDFNLGTIADRRIVTGDHCFGCTAGHGSSCAGALD